MTSPTIGNPSVYVKDYEECQRCGTKRPTSARTFQISDEAVHCTDDVWCARAQRIRDEVQEEFEAPNVYDTIADHLFEQREYQKHLVREWLRANKKRVPVSKDPCAVCKGPVTRDGKSRPKKFCSTKCRMKHHNSKAKR